MKNCTLIILLFLQINFSFACLNGETKILKNGVLLYQDKETFDIPKGHDFTKIDFEKVKKDLNAEYEKTKDIDYLSDVGYILILQEKYQEALSTYLLIELKKPNRYTTASNLGTLYELMGENDKALKWIKKAIEIDPKSHYGSEWLHVNILEAKIKADSISGEDLINTTFGNGNYPETILNKTKLESLKREIYFQLNERISFIKPKDKIISILLYDLANINYLLGKKEDIYLTLYKMAEEYGYDQKIIQDRIGAINTKIANNEITNKGNDKKFDFAKYQTTFILILGLLLVIFLIFKLRKK